MADRPDAPIEQIYKHTLSKMPQDDVDARHVVRVLFQDIRDYLEGDGRKPEKVSEQEILRMALNGSLHLMEKPLTAYETVIANAEIRSGLPQALLAVVRERMSV